MKVVNVLGDGSCFFRSIFVSLKTLAKYTKINEDVFVRSIRNILSRQIRVSKNDLVTDIYRNLYDIKQNDSETFFQMMNAFPCWFVTSFRNFPSTEREFRRVLSSHIKKFQSWVSEIEVRLTQEYFSKNHNIKIVILNSIPNNLRFRKNTIYLLNIGENHYNSIIKNEK